MRAYEIVVIFTEDTTEDEVQIFVNRLEAMAKDSGATLERLDKWGVRDFAYEINKRNRGFYIVLEFLAPSALSEIDRVLRLADEVIRHKIVRLPLDESHRLRDNSIASATAQYRVTLNTGPATTLGQMSLLLADLEVLARLASTWNTIERDLARSGSDREGDTSLLTVAPPRLAASGDSVQIRSLRYYNPVELVVGGTILAFIALLRTLRDWHSNHRLSIAEAAKTEAEAIKTLAEANKISQEATRTQLENELFVNLTNTIDVTPFRASPEAISRLVEESDAINSLVRLAGYEMKIERIDGSKMLEVTDE